LTSFLRKVFLPKYHKDRKYFINHLIDALVLLNIDRSMQQQIHTLANQYKEQKLYKQKEFLNYLRNEYFDKKKIQTKFDVKKAVSFFEEKFNNLELGAYREEVKKINRRYLKEKIFGKKDLQKEKSAVLTPSGYRKKTGFKKIYICKDNQNKFKAIYENYFDTKKSIECKLKDLEIIDILYRYSLIEIKNEIGYVVGGVANQNNIEIIPVNREKEKQDKKNRIVVSKNYKRKLNINPLGVIMK
jgi:hypothetical protein